MKIQFSPWYGVLFALGIITQTQSTAGRFKLIESGCRNIPTFRSLYQSNKLDASSGSFLDASNYKRYKIVSLATFEKTIQTFFKTMNQCLKNRDRWLNSETDLEHFLDLSCKQFFPYAQKITVTPKTKIMFKGDLHGDIHSLCAFIRSLNTHGYTKKSNPLIITDPNFRLVFLGDYVDRGLWGTEVLYILMLLKINNPQQVFLVRGNHEDPAIASRYGFKNEFYNKYRNHDDEDVERCYTLLSKLYEYLPVVLYVGSGAISELRHTRHAAHTKVPIAYLSGTDYQNSTKSLDFIQCCHGGIEFGYNPKNFLQSSHSYEMIQSINRLDECACHYSHCLVQDTRGITRSLADYCSNFTPQTPTYPSPLGFLWHDFLVNSPAHSVWSPGRGLSCNKELTHAVLKASSSSTHRLVGTIRAHQHAPSNHDPMMKLLLNNRGCGQLWQSTPGRFAWGSVFTLLLSPDSLAGTPQVNGTDYTGFTYDTSMLVQTGSALDDWRVTVINNEIYKQ